MSKYKSLSKKNKFYFWVIVGGVSIALLTLGVWGVWSFCYHIYHHEWLKAQLQVALFFVGWFWSSNRRNKKKVKDLNHEIVTMKASRDRAIRDAVKQGFQAGIDFQRKILMDWVAQRSNANQN